MSVAALRERYARLGAEARRATVERYSPLQGVALVLTGISTHGIDAAREQWQAVYYDWTEIIHRFSDPDRLDLALWTEDRLLALGVSRIRGAALWIEIVEGDQANDAPLKGARLAVLFDAFANYAQLRGRSELRLEAKNAGLAALYERVYGFQRVISKEKTLYWARRV